jgi:murein DD-endopeptidase MepM/ murein hydrolase activator NlpD
VRPKAAAHRRILSAGALLFSGALVIGLSVPANAFIPVVGDAASGDVRALTGQSIYVADSAKTDDVSERAEYSVLSAAEELAAERGAGISTYTPTHGSIRWPFPYATTITDGFGYRVSPCAGCSSDHKGVDFTPGDGVPIYSIAGGVVSAVQVSNTGLGNAVTIDHRIDGRLVSSVYAHMRPGSMLVTVGDTVKVGEQIGNVGSTGAVTAPHLHFEVHVEGIQVDPFAWLTEHAN